MGAQRLYHLTHLSNLPQILASGTIYADRAEAWDARPTVDIARADAREARRTAPVPGFEGSFVASFVPFFLSPNATVWTNLRSGENDYRIDAAAAERDPAEFVLLVSTVRDVFESEAEFVVSDGDAAHVLTRFASGRDEAERSLRRLRSDPVSDSISGAELLIREAVDFGSVSLIGVAHDKARGAVRELLAGAAHSPKVAVYPPWFAAVEEAV